MTDLSYFQRYSGRENHATNNTLLMLRYIHELSPQRFERLLATLDGSEDGAGFPGVGPRFAQQERIGTSIPDGVIEQRAFRIYFEAKDAGASLDQAQLLNHIEQIARDRATRPSETGRDAVYLIGLSSGPSHLPIAVEEEAEKKRIRYRSRTFAELLGEIEEVCKGHEALDPILADYRDFLASQGLLPTAYRTMVAFPCGATAERNVETGVYFQAASRNKKQDQAHFVGIYRNKTISHVGRLKAVAVCRTEDGTIAEATVEFRRGEVPGDGGLEPGEEAAIREAIAFGEPLYGAFSEEPTRFYIVERFVKADLRKTTKGAMAGHRYFDLVDMGIPDPAEAGIEAIASVLNGREF